ncbi:serine threonine kinase [Brachionus plicatilis]|uniref:mitogen-activated protein kinase kinase n=1 Tax=Brachionus plicatilis TaxID=10195 RepID=A0A3M7QXC7_BRAPC|nr:serine threonine kinase [Brachionus plicatilis]
MTEEFHKITCDYCKNKSFNSNRYKCLNCSDFDLCSFCFERHVELKDHKLSHLMVMFDSPNNFCGLSIEDSTELDVEFFKQKFQNKEHTDKCKTCDQIIKGVKLKCDICFNYFQCLTCYEQQKKSKNHIFESHPMIVSCKTVLNLDISKIEILKELGHGGYGDVHLARYTNKNGVNNNLALKIIRNKINKNSDYLFKSFLRELDAYNEINGLNILRMIGNTITDEKMYIATEYMEKGSLKDVIEKDRDFGLCERFKVAFGIVSGIVRIHEKGLVHRDIRPDNVLISSDFTAKIGDFGISVGRRPTLAGRSTAGLERPLGRPV